MEFFVRRKLLRPADTLGDFFIGDSRQCYTLEPKVREILGQPVESWKVQNHTAIPVGRYQVIINYSPHFQCLMPLLVGVPGFQGVRVHWGNTAADTDGCILVGSQENLGDMDEVLQSRAAFQPIFHQLDTAIAAGDQVWLTVSNP